MEFLFSSIAIKLVPFYFVLIMAGIGISILGNRFLDGIIQFENSFKEPDFAFQKLLLKSNRLFKSFLWTALFCVAVVVTIVTIINRSPVNVIDPPRYEMQIPNPDAEIRDLTPQRTTDEQRLQHLRERTRIANEKIRDCYNIDNSRAQMRTCINEYEQGDYE